MRPPQLSSQELLTYFWLAYDLSGWQFRDNLIRLRKWHRLPLLSVDFSFPIDRHTKFSWNLLVAVGRLGNSFRRIIRRHMLFVAAVMRRDIGLNKNLVRGLNIVLRAALLPCRPIICARSNGRGLTPIARYLDLLWQISIELGSRVPVLLPVVHSQRCLMRWSGLATFGWLQALHRSYLQQINLHLSKIR